MKKMISLVVVLLLAVVIMTACGAGESTFGPELDPNIDYVKSTVGEIFVDPELFDTNVVLEVELVEICPAGCWLYIADPDDTNNITLYVTRLKDSFTVPMEVEGKIAKVWGKVTANNRGEILEGHRVEVIE